MFENDTDNAVKVAPIMESFQERGLRNDTESSRMRNITFLLKRHQALAAQHPQLILLAITFFFVTLGSGIAIATVYANVEQDELEANALAIAMETGRFFSHHLDRAILPLFSLAQFVREIQEFRELPDMIGLSNAEGSLPFLPPPEGLDRPTHRNVTGVCDDPQILERYTRIADAIKEDADMDGFLVNLQLVPDGVVCLVHPVNNTEDFPPGVHLDSTTSIGHDLLYDPERKFMAEATVASDEVVIVGPIKLLQCPRDDCDPLVEKAFIARLPILSKTNEIFVNGESHLRWGFAVALINWNVLVEKSGIYDEFEKRNLEFQLTRTDYIPNPDDGTTQNIVVVLAESTGYHSNFETYAYAELPTTNNEWAINVAYCTNGCVEWYNWIVPMWTVLSLAISILLYTIFAQQRFHADAMAAKSTMLVESAELSAQSERELNDFIAHEVRNPLAAALSACSFVSAAVNEVEPLVEESTRVMVREDIHVIEASLQFINDLLRSMLDLHRAKSNQLVLHPVPTDMKRDILEPVAAMIYRRDESFEVFVECPDELIFSVDSLRLKQVVLNLARNSAKFVEEGFIRLSAKTTGTCIQICVEDSGPGIPQDKFDQLFAKFQASLDSLSQGTGIGLSLCQKLVCLMNGSITLDEAYRSGIDGRPGTKFDICLPWSSHSSYEDSKFVSDTAKTCVQDNSSNNYRFERLALNESATVASNDDSNFGVAHLPERQKILFVDDDMVLRKLFSRSVKRALPHWSVSEASNGEAALRLTEEENYDIIFVDQYMTSVDKQLLGTETARLMRSQGVNSIICGLSANDMASAFLKAGANAFMIKPFPCKIEPLLEELQRVFNSQRSDATYGPDSVLLSAS